ncbi:MAG TPA: Uma2 family endonuclease [Pilimelia sp.]|nr:Uma2 family endonuclease [Pilimelia sp.]
MTAALHLPERQEWTVDDLGELPKELNYELINGRLVLPSATPLHQDTCIEVVLSLRASCPPEYLVSVDQSLEVDRRNEPRPDVVVIRVEHASRSPVPVRDALLAVEVLSPSSTFRDLHEKAGVYARAGIGTYWVIDALHDKMTLTEFRLEAGGGYRAGAHTDEVFTTEHPWPVTLDLPALTARRDRVLGRRPAPATDPA